MIELLLARGASLDVSGYEYVDALTDGRRPWPVVRRLLDAGGSFEGQEELLVEIVRAREAAGDTEAVAEMFERFPGLRELASEPQAEGGGPAAATDETSSASKGAPPPAGTPKAPAEAPKPPAEPRDWIDFVIEYLLVPGFVLVIVGVIILVLYLQH